MFDNNFDKDIQRAEYEKLKKEIDEENQIME